MMTSIVFEDGDDEDEDDDCDDMVIGDHDN